MNYPVSPMSNFFGFGPWFSFPTFSPYLRASVSPRWGLVFKPGFLVVRVWVFLSNVFLVSPCFRVSVVGVGFGCPMGDLRG